MHVMKRDPVTVYFGGSYWERWSSDYNLTIEYLNRDSVKAEYIENKWVASSGKKELCAAINAALENSLLYRYFSSAAEVYNAIRTCFENGIPFELLHDFIKVLSEPIAAAELMRVLMDDCGFSLERAYGISTQCCGVFRGGLSEKVQKEMMKLQPRTTHVMKLLYESAKNFVNVIHDSSDEEYRMPPTAAYCGQEVMLYFKVQSGLVNSADVKIITSNRELTYPMTKEENGFRITFKAPSETGSFHYYIQLRSRGETMYICPDVSGFTGIVQKEKNAGFRFVVYLKEFETPTWFRRSIMYHIFPDRFARSDDDTARKGIEYHRALGQRPDFHESVDEPVKYQARPGEANYSPDDFYGGTLKGIENRLDYLKDLGISTIYLNPIVEARSNHRYDASDYLNVDPILGTVEDFEHLCAKAEKMGIRLILDGVYSHTGADSIYFNRYGNYPNAGACQGPKSPFYSWYCFSHFPDVYKSWWGFTDLPEVNELDPQWQKMVISGKNSPVQTWLRRGASGWRLDVADELPDEALSIIRKSAKSVKPDAPIIGEVWEDPTDKESYGTKRNYAFGYSLDSVMNYPLRTAIIDFLKGNMSAYGLRDFLISQRMNYPKPLYYSLMNLLGSHDMERIRSALSVDVTIKTLPREEQLKLVFTPERLERALMLEKLGAAIQFSLPGVPSIYYGDEQGMCGVGDPFNRAMFKENDCGLHEFYREMTQMRKEHPCMSEGRAYFYALSANLIAIIRYNVDGINVFGERTGDSAAAVLVNRGSDVEKCVIDLTSKGLGMLDETVPPESYRIVSLL